MFEEVEHRGDASVAARLYEIAEPNAGYVTARAAAAAGIPRSTIAHHARPGGRLIHVDRGLYRLRDFPSSIHEHIVAGWLSAPPSADAVVSHESALEMLDLSDIIADGVHLTVPRARWRKPIEGVVVHPTTYPVEKWHRRQMSGIPVTSAERTIIDMLRELGITEQVEMAATQALQRGLTSERRLSEAAAMFPITVQRKVALLLP